MYVLFGVLRLKATFLFLGDSIVNNFFCDVSYLNVLMLYTVIFVLYVSCRQVTCASR